MSSPVIPVIRCAGCGRLVENRDRVFEVIAGMLIHDEVVTSSPVSWGVFHESCFQRAVRSPMLALEKIRKTHKAAKRTGASTT